MLLPSLSRELLRPGRAALARITLDHGFVHAFSRGRELFLFVREGRAWCAGTTEDGSPGALAVSDFVAAADSFEQAFLCRTDLPLFLCAAVLFRKPPAAHMPAALIDGEALLKSISALGKDAVVAVQRGDAWALAFCRSGEPVALYAAEELGVPSTGTAADRLMELIYADPRAVTIDVYDDIRLPPADIRPPPAAEAPVPVVTRGPHPVLVVLIGERVVFRHRIDKAETLVGRGEDVDLALDNLSVSRRHAKIAVGPDGLVIEDLGSENGITVDGFRTGRAFLKPGERVGVGKYTLAYAIHATADDQAQPRRTTTTADIATVAVTARRAVLEHAGERHKVASVVFTIGSSPEAHLRIRGLLVPAVQAVLQVDGDGYRIDHMGGARALKVNGAPTKRAKLVDGDEIVVAGERMTFRQA